MNCDFLFNKLCDILKKRYEKFKNDNTFKITEETFRCDLFRLLIKNGIKHENIFTEFEPGDLTKNNKLRNKSIDILFEEKKVFAAIEIKVLINRSASTDSIGRSIRDLLKLHEMKKGITDHNKINITKQYFVCAIDKQIRNTIKSSYDNFIFQDNYELKQIHKNIKSKETIKKILKTIINKNKIETKLAGIKIKNIYKSWEPEKYNDVDLAVLELV